MSCSIDKEKPNEEKEQKMEKDQKEEDKQKRVDVLPMKIWAFLIIVGVILLGFLGPFLAQAVLPFFRDCEKDTARESLEIWNLYVSIVLGVCATLMSVLSLIIGFWTLEHGHETELANKRTLTKIEVGVEEMKKNVADINTRITVQQTKMESVEPTADPQTAADEK